MVSNVIQKLKDLLLLCFTDRSPSPLQKTEKQDAVQQATTFYLP